MGFRISQAVNAGRLTVVTGVAHTVISSRLGSTRTLTVGLCSTNLIASRTTAIAVFEVDLKLANGGLVFTAEVIATGAACIATHTTLVVMTDIAVDIGSNISAISSSKVITTTPGGAIATVDELVMSVAIMAVLVVVG